MKYLKSKKIIAGLFICVIISSGLFAESLVNIFVHKMPEIETKPVRPLRENQKEDEKIKPNHFSEDSKDGKRFERPDMPKLDKDDWKKDRDKRPDFKGKRPGAKKDFHAKPKCCNGECCDFEKKPFPKKPFPKKDLKENPLKEK